MDEVYVSLLNIISQKVVPHFYMFGSGVKHEIFGNTKDTRAITHARHMGTLLTKVTQRVCDPKHLGATTSGSNILGFCGRLSYTRLFARRPRNKQRTQKLTSPRSQLPIDSIPAKSASEKPRSEREEDVKYQRPSSGVYRRYLKICLMACRCEVLGDA
jgi:hypothetical protein